MTLTTLLLTLLFSAPANLADAELTIEAMTPVEALANTRNGWLAFEFPMSESRHGPCCWRGHSGDAKLGCSLERSQGSFSLSDGRRIPASDSAQVYLRMRSGEPDELRIFNTACPIDAGNQRVAWLEAVASDASIAFLTAMAGERRESVAHGALQGIAFHGDESAGRELHEIAATRRGDLAEAAIFWLGEARGEAGYRYLAQLLDELPRGDLRRQINFALSQNDTLAAGDLLLRISREDPDDEQRGDALFWLADSEHPRALEALAKALEQDPSKEVAHRALHALAELGSSDAAHLLEQVAGNHRSGEVRGQALFWLGEGYPEQALPVLAAALDDPGIDDDTANQALLALAELERKEAARVLAGTARKHPDPDVRSQALFWLAEGYPRQALPVITEALSGESDREVRERAVFALSQLPDEQATGALLELVRGPYPDPIRKQALFWLAESDDPAALDALEKLLGAD